MGTPDMEKLSFWIMVCVEFIFLLEIIFGFFLQAKNEEGKSMQQPLVQVSENYIKQKLLLDVAIVIPLGEIGAQLVH